MSELPPHDLRDGAGRARRLVLSLLLGAAGGVLAYVIGSRFIDTGGPEAAHVSSRQMSSDTFVIWLCLVAFVVTFAVALVVQNHLAKKRWRGALVPQAKVR